MTAAGIVGVDAGGTWVRACLARDGHKRRARVRSTGDLSAAVRALFARLRLARADALVVGARGVWDPAQRRRATRALAPFARRVRVLSDMELAWWGALGPEDGVLVVSGTGSAAFARAGRRSARVGGLGPLLGDEGSAFWIGRQWLRARPEPFALRWARRPDAVPAIASLARSVLSRAARDRRARAILAEAAGHLARQAARAARAVRLPRARVSWAGGMLADARFRALFAARLRDELPGARLEPPRLSPEDAAALLLG
ncbi:MAG TPA: BadF/BadG/BcrA/BcrD ATPase family protein [Elusimicrobiota bacterium]|jgi:N-acetylglucosamine kinase-like BadF-type ATPase|nr:BadF/BadG/BcrA/BcrD ATPase family protein [Elusimicrobiota bacterium]